MSNEPPDWKRYIREHLSKLGLKSEREQEITEELAGHLETAYEAALSKGLSESEARALALEQFSDWQLMECELSRSERWLGQSMIDKSLALEDRMFEAKTRSRTAAIIGSLFQDSRHGIRWLRRNRAFTIVAALTLALGIGASTAIFTVVNAVLIRPLPYAEAERLVTLWSMEDYQYGTNVAEYIDIRQRQNALDDIAVYSVTGGNLNSGGEPVRATIALVTAGFFRVLGVQPTLGRTFVEEEDTPGKNSVAVIRYGFWQSHFGGDRSVIGRTIFVQGRGVTIVGIGPRDFSFPDNSVDLWMPLGVNSANPGGRGRHSLSSVARLRPDVSIELASADIRRISLEMHQENPESYPEQMRGGWTLRWKHLQASIVQDAQPSLLLLMGAVGLVLLIACVNVANLLLARAASRGQEIAVRTALGASRRRLIQQLLTESTLLSLAGGLLGLGVAVGLLDLLRKSGPSSIPRLSEIGIDYRVLLFTLLLSILTGVLFGMAPALFAVRRDLHTPLKEGGREMVSAGRKYLRNALVIIEVALSMVLLISGALLTRSFYRLSTADTGFRAENVLTSRLSLSRDRYPTPESRARFYQQLLRRLETLPGVKGVGAISALPLSQDFSSALMAEGMPPNVAGFAHGLITLASPRVVAPGYFQVMEVNLLRGRLFNEADSVDAARVAIVSDEFSRLAWPDGQNPIGKRVAFASNEPEWYTVVGVTKDVREEAGNLASQRYKDAYFPLAQLPTSEMFLTVKTSTAPASLISPIRQEVSAMDATLPLHEVRTMDDVLAQAVVQPRFNALLMTTLGVLALILGAVGIYGVLSYTFNQQRREIGLRMVLGAQTGNILRQFVGRGMSLVIMGWVLGVGVSLATSRLLGGLLYGVPATDWIAYTGVSGLLMLVALAACYLPARRATKLDLTVTLRCE